MEYKIDFGPGFPQRTISVRGLFGSAFVDFDANVCSVDRLTPSDPDFDRYSRSVRLARELRQQARKTLAVLERRGGAALDAVLPAVKKIVADVRKGGDRALLRYAAKFDGLARASALRATKEEMAAAWEATASGTSASPSSTLAT